MTELLANGDKVEIALGTKDTTTVPTGKVWKVTLNSTGTMLIKDPSGTNYGRLKDTNTLDSSQTMTLHEGWTVDQNTAEGMVSGWEFDYSQ